jgi:hypothetical protein
VLCISKAVRPGEEIPSSLPRLFKLCAQLQGTGSKGVLRNCALTIVKDESLRAAQDEFVDMLSVDEKLRKNRG